MSFEKISHNNQNFDTLEFRFFIASDDAEAVKEKEQVVKAIASSPEATAKIEKFFHDNTSELIKAASYSPVVGKTHLVDIVRDVFKFVPLRWAATEIVRFNLNHIVAGTQL